MDNNIFDLEKARLNRLLVGKGNLSGLEKNMLAAYDAIILAGSAIIDMALEVKERKDQTLAAKTRSLINSFTALHKGINALIEYQFEPIEWLPDEAVKEV